MAKDPWKGMRTPSAPPKMPDFLPPVANENQKIEKIIEETEKPVSSQDRLRMMGLGSGGFKPKSKVQGYRKGGTVKRKKGRRRII